MNARWLMAMLWALIALALSLLLGGTLFVWLGHLLYRPGSSHASADWLFHVFVVGLPATVTAWVSWRGCLGKLPGTERDRQS